MNRPTPNNSPMPRRVPACVLLLAALHAIPAPRLQAQDRVVVRNASGVGQLAMTGTIIDYAGQRVTMKTRSGQRREFDAAQLVEIQTPQSAPHANGLRLMRRGNYREARQSFSSAIAEEKRTWVRRDILALMVRCSLALDDYASAVSRFLTLVGSDPQTRHFRDIPLCWGDDSLSDALRADARSWLADDSEIARLIGASFLLDELKTRDFAEAEFHRLRRGRDPRVVEFARMQLWRQNLREGDVSLRTIARWEQNVKALPEELRAGPWYLVGKAYVMNKDYERAAIAFLWLPTIYDRNQEFAARGAVSAAQALIAIGQKTEAATLCREVVGRFTHSGHTAQAQAILDSIQPTQPPG